MKPSVWILACIAIGCGSTNSTTTNGTGSGSATTNVQALTPEQAEYVDDVATFTKTTPAQVRERMKLGSVPLKTEWEAWEKQGPMTSERMLAFYKQTTNYIYELGEWHLFVEAKHQSNTALFDSLDANKPKNVLDFGGGVGFHSIGLARRGHDVTLADLDGTSLTFAKFRADRHEIPLKIWKSDVEPAPPDQKYDVILLMDVVEHLPPDVLVEIVDKLIKLKHEKTEIIMQAPFGRTSVHPMHLDETEHTRKHVARLKTELPE